MSATHLEPGVPQTGPAPTALPETVVVVGASGFIGRNLVRHLSRRVGHIVPVSASGRDVEGIPGWRLADLDGAGLGPDAIVVNVAAYRYDVANFAAAQPEIFARNVEIVTGVYEFCARSGITEVRTAGSMAVYAAADAINDDTRPIDLGSEPHDSELMYGWSKRIAEVTAELFRRKCGIHTLTLRLTNPYGPYDAVDETKAHVVPAFVIRALTSSGPFTLRGNPAATRDFIYVGDVCEVFCRSLTWRGQDAAYNLGSGENVAIGDLARMILRLAGSEREIVETGTPPGGVTHRRVTNERVRADFAIERFTPLEDGLIPTIEWYRDACRARS